MTSTVKNIKVGNTSYPVQDTGAVPALTEPEVTTLYSNGTYRGDVVSNGTVFFRPYYATTYKYTISGSGVDTVTVGSLNNVSGVNPLYNQPWVTCANGTYVYTEQGNSVYYSSDGITYTASNLAISDIYGLDSGEVYDMLQETNKTVFMIATDVGVYYSNDGQTWTICEDGMGGTFTSTLNGLTFYDNQFFGVVGTNVYACQDGVTWMNLSSLPSSVSNPVIGYSQGPLVLSKMGSSAYYYGNAVTMPTVQDMNYAFCVDMKPTSMGLCALLAYQWDGGAGINYYVCYGYGDGSVDFTWGAPTYVGPAIQSMYSDESYGASELWDVGNCLCFFAVFYDSTNQSYAYTMRYIKPDTNEVGYISNPDLSFYSSYMPNVGITPNGTTGELYNYFDNQYRIVSISFDAITRALVQQDYNKTAVDNLLATKQGTLTAGTGITIDENNIISASSASYDSAIQEITLN